MWEFLMKAVWVAPNEEDGWSMKQNDENQLSGGGFSLAFTLPLLLPVFCRCFMNTQTVFITELQS